MKISNVHRAAFGLMFFAFMLLSLPAVMAQSIKGSGEVKSQSRSVSNIRGIEVSGGFVVEVTQGSNEGVRLEAQENLLDNIKTEVRNGILHIYNDKGISTSKSMKAFVTLQNMESINISGGVKVIGNSSFKAPVLKLDMSGGSNVKLTIATDQVKGNLSGASKVELLGKAGEVNMQLSGASKMEASELEAKQVYVQASGASSVKVYAQEALDINASGASAVYYKGSPSITSNVSSAARVGKL
ncbi:head GIN domain-containing protein [Pontibacter litorisediminis]|uniref:head GIN domain-containing protein n=1 Tax=Pontibacter litorisediminis TaxID=1846260 RepID=UPI0023EAB7D0|nr:head GIN domain-containing protein [Pontibacter litorisediminis]